MFSFSFLFLKKKLFFKTSFSNLNEHLLAEKKTSLHQSSYMFYVLKYRFYHYYFCILVYDEISITQSIWQMLRNLAYRRNPDELAVAIET